MKNEASIPVFIVHWNRPEECLRTVQSFLAQPLPLSISVLDNASEPARYEQLRNSLPASVKLTRIETNKGWGGGLNVLLKEWLAAPQSGQLCFVSAHDALPQDGCMAALVAAMQQDPRIGIACPEYGEASVMTYSPLAGPRLVPVTPREPGTIETMPCPHGTLIALKRDCLQEIGIFDERYFAYGDEYDLGLRATSKNWKVVVVWGAIVVNPGSWTPSPVLCYLSSRNSLLMALTYGGLAVALLRSLLMALNVVRIVCSTKAADRGFFSPKARLIAVTDFLTSRFGAPSFQARK